MTHMIVVGGGAMGSAAAWRLSAAGAAVTLLEQFGPRHDAGASHGSSRIFRLAYPDQHHVQLARQALALWRQLEREVGRAVLTLTGAVDHGPERPVRQLHASLLTAGAAAELLPSAEAARRWPGLRFEEHVLFHPDAGRLHADDAVVALQEAAASRGADVRHGIRVNDVDTSGGRAVVTTDTGEVLSADRVVLAAGAWTPGLRPELADVLRTTQEQPAHFAPRETATPWPSFIHHPGAALPTTGATSGGVYGLGSDDGVKVGFHAQGPVVDPDHRDRTPDPAALAALRSYAERWLPGVDPTRATPTTCLYTLTPDHRFVVDDVAGSTVLAGFSGHGFKFATAIGELAAGLSLGRTTADEPFAARRFTGAPA